MKIVQWHYSSCVTQVTDVFTILTSSETYKKIYQIKQSVQILKATALCDMVQVVTFISSPNYNTSVSITPIIYK